MGIPRSTKLRKKLNTAYFLTSKYQPFPRRYAQYSNFKMHGEKDNYKLEIGGYEGNAGDSMNDPWYGSNLSPFSTYDRSVRHLETLHGEDGQRWRWR